MGQHREVEWYDNIYQDFSVFDREPLFNQRAEIISDWIKKDECSAVFECAGGGCLIAQKALQKSNVEYIWTDFLPKAVENATSKGIYAYEFDIEKDYKSILWNDFDAFVCVSLEHLENDTDIITDLPSGMNVYLSCPNIDAEDHIRILDTDDKIGERYGDLIEIQEIKCISNGSLELRLVRGRRR